MLTLGIQNSPYVQEDKIHPLCPSQPLWLSKELLENTPPDDMSLSSCSASSDSEKTVEHTPPEAMSLSSCSASSNSEKTLEDTVYKVSFSVQQFWFKFNDASPLVKEGFDVKKDTIFCAITIIDDAVQALPAWRLKSIPLELVKQALANPLKNVRFNWFENDFEIQFTESGKSLSEQMLADRIKSIDTDTSVKVREILSDEDVDFFIDSTYLPALKV